MLDIASELAELKVPFDATDGKIKLCCPFHDDSSPSCVVDTQTGRFHCFTADCKASGDLILFLSRLRKEKPVETRKYIQQKFGVNLDKTLAASLIEDCHQAIWEQTRLLAELKKRAITPELITKFRLGFQNERITIPIPNSAGFYVSLRLYSPGAKVNKFVSLKGYGGNFLFPHDQLSYDKILIVGGEIKAIACSAVLNPHGIGVVTGTHGEGQFEAVWIPLLSEKEVYVCMDVDDAGEKASARLCHMLANGVQTLRETRLSTDIPKGGPDDYVAAGGDLLAALASSPEWAPDTPLEDGEPQNTSLSRAFAADLSGQRTKYKATISCIGQNVFHVPKTVCVNCSKSEPECTICPTVLPSKDKEFTMHPESAFILETAGCTKVSQQFAVRDALTIPSTCKAWNYTTVDRYSVEDVRVSPELEITNREVDRELQPAFIVKDENDQAVFSNETYELTGRTWPSPKTQEAVSVISDYEMVESALESYVCEDVERLRVFQPVEWTVEGVREKLSHIYADLSANVTRIYRREELHLATDLTYHSPLFFTFDGKEQNGWVSTLIIGDSAQGKSEVVERLKTHYKLGEIVDCASTTPAGILGGLDKIGGTFFTTWGVLPQHDKRLVIFEELKEADEGLLGRMNDARSRGLVKLTKIKNATAKARARTVFITNPKRGGMADYNYGIDAIADLIPQPQYVRRFDLSILVNKTEVDSKKLQLERPTVPHTYTTELCNELVLWAWTLKDVTFENEHKILELAVTLTEQYSEDVPLIDRGSMRLKLARLAAAVAARTYSTSTSQEGLIVRDCHVQFIYEFLNKMYSKETFGYAEYSRVQKELNELKNPKVVLKSINILPHPRDFVDATLRANNIDLQHIIDTSGFDRSQGQAFLSFLVRYRALKKKGRSYYKSEQFTLNLKRWVSEGKIEDPPEFGEGEFGDTL